MRRSIIVATALMACPPAAALACDMHGGYAGYGGYGGYAAYGATAADGAPMTPIPVAQPTPEQAVANMRATFLARYAVKVEAETPATATAMVAAKPSR